MLELVLGPLETTEADEIEGAITTLEDTVGELESTEVENEDTELAPIEFKTETTNDDDEEDEMMFPGVPDVLDAELIDVVCEVPDSEDRTIVVVAGTLGTVTAQDSVTYEVGLMLRTTVTDGGASVME